MERPPDRPACQVASRLGTAQAQAKPCPGLEKSFKQFKAEAHSQEESAEGPSQPISHLRLCQSVRRACKASSRSWHPFRRDSDSPTMVWSSTACPAQADGPDEKWLQLQQDRFRATTELNENERQTGCVRGAQGTPAQNRGEPEGHGWFTSG